MLGKRYEIRNATKDDLMFIAGRLRDSDRAECDALGHVGVNAAYRAMLRATEARVGVADGVPFVAFGLGVPLVFAHYANPWLLGTGEIVKHRLTFLRESRGIVADWLQRYPVLENYVDQRNSLSIAWLKWLGFKLYDAIPYGPQGLPFCRFELRA